MNKNLDKNVKLVISAAIKDVKRASFVYSWRITSNSGSERARRAYFRNKIAIWNAIEAMKNNVAKLKRDFKLYRSGHDELKGIVQLDDATIYNDCIQMLVPMYRVEGLVNYD